MYYKKDIYDIWQPQPEATKKIKVGRNIISPPSVDMLLDNGYYPFVSPTIGEYQKPTSTIVKVPYKKEVTNEVVEMSQLEKDMKINSWEVGADRLIRVTVSAVLVEEVSGTSDENLIKFRNVLKLRQCPEFYNSVPPRSYSVYLKEWYSGEKEMLESLPNYDTWIANGETLTVPYMIITDLTPDLIVE